MTSQPDIGAVVACSLELTMTSPARWMFYFLLARQRFRFVKIILIQEPIDMSD